MSWKPSSSSREDSIQPPRRRTSAGRSLLSRWCWGGLRGKTRSSPSVAKDWCTTRRCRIRSSPLPLALLVIHRPAFGMGMHHGESYQLAPHLELLHQRPISIGDRLRFLHWFSSSSVRACCGCSCRCERKRRTYDFCTLIPATSDSELRFARSPSQPSPARLKTRSGPRVDSSGPRLSHLWSSLSFLVSAHGRSSGQFQHARA